MVEKRVKKFGQGSPPPPFRAMPERKHFFSGGLPLYSLVKGHIPQLDWIIVPLFVKFPKSSDLVIGTKVATELCER